MLSINDLHFSYQDKKLLNGVSFSVGKMEKVGLVGVNGIGKSTIFKLIVGQLKPEKGAIDKGSVSYLPQHFEFNDLTVGQFLNQKEDQSYKVDKALDQLGLAGIDKNQKADSLSGGEKTRIYLASILNSEDLPGLLLLDEPTNNLDLEGLDWLEDFIRNFKGSVLLTSHDRYFLDRSVDKILELQDGQIKIYGGNYSFYREQKLIEQKSQLEKYHKNVEEVKRLERLILEKREKIRSLVHSQGSDNDKFAKGFFRNRGINKASAARKGIESRLDQLQRLDKPQQRVGYKVGFVGQTAKGKTILQVEDLAQSFSGKDVFKGVTFIVTGNEHLWVAGKNGFGKSTLLKIISGDLKADLGSVHLGSEVKSGFFSQEHSNLNLDKTGIEELLTTEVPETDCFWHAAKLHLLAADLRKPIKELSRGQIAKLEFVKLLLGNNQLLILDEPTNHLEIETREEIEEALKQYQGAIVVSSHDRYFLDSIGIDQVLNLD